MAVHLELPIQLFSESPLERACNAKQLQLDSINDDRTEVCLVVVAGRELCVRPVNPGETPEGDPTIQQELQVLLLPASDPQLDLLGESMWFLWSETDDDDSAQSLPLYLLGQDALGRWTFALDISGPCKLSFLDYLQSSCGLDVSMDDLRNVMPTLSRDACALAGHAAALSQWHLTHRFCPRTGAPTIPVEGGMRRKSEKGHKLYPRTDPVVIMLVESPDGQRALLGRSRKFAPGMYTCLSGFIDQCESIEEAVRREVREEARVPVADVQIVGSQPWPIGRYGSCELMLGCMAKALSYEIMIDTGEMEDVQWYDRNELAAAAGLFDELKIGSSVDEIQAQSMDTLGFFVPPPFAIAHHLIRLWSQHAGPWFPTPQLPVPPPPAGANGSTAPSNGAVQPALAITQPGDLPIQCFADSPLQRIVDPKKRFSVASADAPEVCLVVVSGRELCIRPVSPGEAADPRCKHELQVLLLASEDPQLDMSSDFMCFLWSQDEGDDVLQLPLYLLGQDALGRWTFALDISGPCKLSFLDYLQSSCGLDVSMDDLRNVMPTLSRDACALAGHAAALSQWHCSHSFCPRSGAPTTSIEGGLRRKSTKGHKLYPRTDPVVIMLVESPDGQRALLGRSRKFTPGMYTCLSGFIDQCESIEEAVRREVREEARVPVADVQIVGSQPWPIGRYGSCELMLGCMAKALSYEIMIDTTEMEDVQWYDKSELAAAAALFDELQSEMSVTEIQAQSMDTLGFFIPAPFAIAHHLIRLWSQHAGPWFPTPQLPVPPPLAGANGSTAPSNGAAAEPVLHNSNL